MKNFKLYENFLNEAVDDGSSIILRDMTTFEIIARDILSSQGVRDLEFGSVTLQPGNEKLFKVSFKLWFIKNSQSHEGLIPSSKVSGPYFTEQEAKDALSTIEIGHLDFLKKWKPSASSEATRQGLYHYPYTHPSSVNKYLTNNLQVDYLNILLDGKDFVKLCRKNEIDVKSFIEKNRLKISAKKYDL